MGKVDPIYGYSEELTPCFSEGAQSWAFLLRSSSLAGTKAIFKALLFNADKYGWKVPSYSTFKKFMTGIDAAIAKIRKDLRPADLPEVQFLFPAPAITEAAKAKNFIACDWA